ncbi:DUF982 domain-containing protein [Phyllobacterium lublinensis]|jgi:hypothetical protein|uniref:DUF982 domain-containing protein n=1 Tax=Phyllobacterium lublinensis TaxID=2875708 RepID=UPI001CCB1D91|nr:DUF982 domain-containing protein [Phyllobacterium sp. 2063]MBZ9655191.1 DUF982 domain-containing protein [Phyllobacterium sp. 2063]
MDQNAFQPLTLETDQSGNLQTIESVQAALDFLALKWPPDNEHFQEKAIRMCKLALQGEASAAVARDVFVEAARQSGMLVRPGRERS